MLAETALMLLDPERMVSVLAGLGALKVNPPSSIELRSTWVKPGRYFNAHYRIADGLDREGPMAVSAFLVDEARGRRVVEKAGTHTCEDGSRSACRACNTAYVPPGVLLQSFPGDYRLPTLPRCLQPKRLRAETQGEFRPLGGEVVAYRPGMRCQILYSMKNGGRVFGKVAVEKRGAGYGFGVHARLYDALRSRTRSVRLPEPLAYVEPLRLALIAAAEGTDLSKVMRRSEEQARLAMPRVASALAELHGVDIDTHGRTHPVSSEALLLDAWVSLLESMYPELGRKIAALTARLAACRPAPSPRPVLLHRDFYDKQILLGGEHITLLDMDTVGFGDAELDVANFCVHVWLRGIQHDGKESSESLQAAFLAAYPSEIDAKRLAWYRNATLLRLAGNYALRPKWRHIIDDLVAEAEKGLGAS
jgi:hypothetical protein